ncbi:putative site-specific recombinase [Bacillus sp. TS-2]|nr:putative site-specific recombinase [Bacillus sp. TS-2]
MFKKTDWTVDVLKRIYQDYLNGQGIDSIAKQLTLEGVPTPAMVVDKKNAGEYWRGSVTKETEVIISYYFRDSMAV